MPSHDIPRQLRGVIPPVVTPLADDEELDAAGMSRLMDHLLAGGVHGLFVLGTCGEGPSLSRRVQRHVVELACERAAGDLPVLVGVTHTSLSESLDLAEAAYSAGADFIVAAAPFYYDVGQSELRAWFERMADESPLPLVLYNMPSRTGHVLERETVARLSEHPNIAGLKDSAGDLDAFARVRAAADEDFPILVGPEVLLCDAMHRGAAGGVCGGANLRPRLFVQLYQAATAGDWEQARRLQSRIEAVAAKIHHLSESSGRVILGLKAALSAMGVCGERVAPPLPPLTEDQLQQAAAIVEQFDLRAEAPVKS